MSDWLGPLRDALGDGVSSDPEVLERHRRDSWVLGELEVLEGRSAPGPAAVVMPRTTQEVAGALRILRDARVPVVPFGGGSGVCGGVRSGRDSVVLSTERLKGLVGLDDRALVASFRAGTLGVEAERRVEEAGLTIGHWPQSIALSSVGGWVATRAAGQYSTAYGCIEDLLLDLEVVLPDGAVLRTRRTPRASTGPDLRQLFLGSEGTLGIVTEASFSLRPLPETRRGAAFSFAGMEDGLEAIRLGMRGGHRPPVVRLYDPSEAKRGFSDFCPKGRALLLLLHEGASGVVAAEAEALSRICVDAGGLPADAAAVDHWLAERNQVPGFRSFLERGIILDTIEVAATWGRVHRLYERTVGSLREVEGILTASAHASHAYRSGANLYFTFAARPPDRSRMADTYRECWRRVMEATLAEGGGISHHHGIGRVRRPFLTGEIGESGVAVLRAVKRALDPEDLMNPGVLLP